MCNDILKTIQLIVVNDRLLLPERRREYQSLFINVFNLEPSPPLFTALLINLEDEALVRYISFFGITTEYEDMLAVYLPTASLRRQNKASDTVRRLHMQGEPGICGDGVAGDLIDELCGASPAAESKNVFLVKYAGAMVADRIFHWLNLAPAIVFDIIAFAALGDDLSRGLLVVSIAYYPSESVDEPFTEDKTMRITRCYQISASSHLHVFDV